MDGQRAAAIDEHRTAGRIEREYNGIRTGSAGGPGVDLAPGDAQRRAHRRGDRHKQFTLLLARTAQRCIGSNGDAQRNLVAAGRPLGDRHARGHPGDCAYGRRHLGRPPVGHDIAGLGHSRDLTGDVSCKGHILIRQEYRVRRRTRGAGRAVAHLVDGDHIEHGAVAGHGTERCAIPNENGMGGLDDQRR